MSHFAEKRLQNIEIEFDRISMQAERNNDPVPARLWIDVLKSAIWYAIDSGFLPGVIKEIVDAEAADVETFRIDPNMKTERDRLVRAATSGKTTEEIQVAMDLLDDNC